MSATDGPESEGTEAESPPPEAESPEAENSDTEAEDAESSEPESPEAESPEAGTTTVQAPPDELSWIVTRHRERLTTAGIETLAQLLDQTRCPGRRRALAAELDLPSGTLLQWASISSLLRMEELDVNMATRLCALGVDGPPCLAQQRPEVLRARLHERQGDLKLPSLDWLQALITAAASHERVVWY